MQNMEIMWLVLLILFLVAEGATAAVTTIWFAIGAIVAMFAAIFGAEIWLQAVLFAVVSVICLLSLRPVLKKYITPKIVPTNVDSLIGTEGIVIEEIDNINAKGRVKLGGMEWSARSTSKEIISAGSKVQVDRISGVKAYVTPVNDPVYKD